MPINFSDFLDKDFKLSKASVPPTMEQLVKLRRELNCRLPDDYMFYLAQNGATYLEVREDVWPKPKQYEVRPSWEMMSAIMVLGISSKEEEENFPDMLNIKVITPQFKNMFNSDLIPFFKWQSDNVISCFDTNGKIFNLSYSDPENPEPVNMDFKEFLESEMRKLVENKNRYKGK
ncbi:MAG: hypothetical protein K0S32_1128 [Bacteroidetes bacterium]|jgi:hypothetical protein|nr:hypothetical protein [Bacteroidota bacterium]